MSDCACIRVEVNESSTSKIYGGAYRVAKKIEKCIECDRDINLCELYYKELSRWHSVNCEECENPEDCKEYEYIEVITCPECIEIRNIFFCDNFIYNEMHERIENHIYDENGKISLECVEKLSKKAREKFFEIAQEIFDQLNKEEEE